MVRGPPFRYEAGPGWALALYKKLVQFYHFILVMNETIYLRPNLEQTISPKQNATATAGDGVDVEL